MARGLKVLGLTGGIGVGKSTVAGLFARAGSRSSTPTCSRARWWRPASPPRPTIAAAWPEVIGEDGAIDRKRLGAIVFGAPAALARLEAITHPRIRTLAAERLAALAAAGHRLAIYEASQLVEAGRHRDVDGVIVVTAVARDRRSPASSPGKVSPASSAEARIRAQAPLADKLRVATYVIDNDGDLTATEAQVDRLLAELSRPA